MLHQDGIAAIYEYAHAHDKLPKMPLPAIKMSVVKKLVGIKQEKKLNQKLNLQIKEKIMVYIILFLIIMLI